MMKQISTALISTVLLFHALGCSNGNVRAAAPPPPPMVEVAPVIQKDVPVQGEWVGTLEGYVNAQIQPQVSGYLIRQDYHEGAFVKKGQLLFEIDPRPFQAVLDQAKGQLAQAEAQMANAETNVKRDIPEAEAHAIPQSQLDTDTQSLRGAKAGVEAGQAAVEQAELNLGYTRVVSLIDGIAGINTVQVGNLVGPSTVLTAVSQVSPIKVYFPISEQEYLRMADGGGPGSVDFLTHASQIPLQLTLADGSAYAHPGRIIFADRQVNTQTGTIQIVGEFPNSRNLLRPGQYARIQTPTGNITGALLVPQAAVNQQQGTYQVTVVGTDNRAQLRTVQVGPRVDTLWVITAGLKPGERVIEAGCGWGSLALFMAKRYGVSVRAFNISPEQIAYARQRATEENLTDRVDFIEDDYRNIDGECDVFVSVGMLEHVGLADYRTLGGVIARVLTDRGRGFLHFIGRNKPAPLNPWIRKRIFPGAYPPTLREVFERVLEPQNLAVLDVENLRLHYGKTLEHWQQRFNDALPRVASMFDEMFVRAWQLYLAGSQAAFTTGSMQLFQVVFARGASNAIPWTRGDD